MEKNNSKVCTICHKSFSSGKALGGHMRSHSTMLTIPPKPETENQVLGNSPELTHSPIQSRASHTFNPKKKEIKSFRSLKCDFFTSSTNLDTVREFESYPKNPTRKRSKRHRKFIVVADTKAEPKPMSSISETLQAEEAARTLVMLLKDKWPESKEIKKTKVKKNNKKEGKDNENGRDDWLVHTRSRSRYTCRMCPRTFQSHQALGGHVAYHNKIENICREGRDTEDNKSVNNSDVVDQKVFECSFYYKVLTSAQALDGHNSQEEVEEVSPIEFSTVSNEELVL